MSDDVITATSLFPGGVKNVSLLVSLLLFLFAIGLWICGVLPGHCAGAIILFGIVMACCCVTGTIC